MVNRWYSLSVVANDQYFISSLRLDVVEIKYKKWWGRFVVIDSRRGHSALTLTLLDS